MAFSKQLLLHLIFIFLLLNASEAKRCSRNVDETALKLLNSGLSLVQEIDCAFEKTTTLEVKYFSSFKSGLYNFILLVLKLTCLSLVALLVAITTCVAYVTFSSERLPTQIRRSVARLAARNPRSGRAKSMTVRLYKKVVLGTDMKLTGRNDTVCPICLSESASNETVGCLLGCEHCFHIECMDTWLQLHCSCPICRNEGSPKPND